uniref:PDZ domain-containing protein n=1 Tax=Oryza punctata TaxID=4537 RepID=A0A0E0L7T5_ORYPU
MRMNGTVGVRGCRRRRSLVEQHNNQGTRHLQIRNMPRQKRNRRGDTNRGYKACYSDPSDVSDGTLSELVKYNSDQAEHLTKDALNEFGAVFETCKSVVFLASTHDTNPVFSCSGTVVEHVESETWILTSATLVRKPGIEHEAYNSDDIKIKVVLHNKQDVEGCLAMCDLHYNLAIVTIKSPISLPAVKLSDLPECYSMQPMPVVSVGRDYFSVVLMRCGKLIRLSSELDCDELLVTVCEASEHFIGGPIVDMENRILGITFFNEDDTPFLPVEIAARCLKSFKRNCGGIEVGDVISKLDDVDLYSVAQFTTMLLDKMEAANGTQNTVTSQMVVDARYEEMVE